MVRMTNAARFSALSSPSLFAPLNASWDGVCLMAMLEKLDGTLVFLGGLSGRESAQVAALAGASILLARIQPIFAGFEFSDHDESLRLLEGKDPDTDGAKSVPI